jgi:hypothetical protein
MTTQIRISAKALGELAMPDFCPRCFWVKLRLNNKLPFQIFPGIFNSIDAYTKNVIHGYFDTHGKFPSWLDGLGELKGYKKAPHYSTFNYLDSDSEVLLTGTPDGILVKPDGSHIIVDYKTAKYTQAQDELLPMYEVQLNGYALIGEKCGLSPISELALIYMEPVTHAGAANDVINHRDSGFAMGFSAHIHKVALNPNAIYPLLVKVRKISELNSAPAGCSGCKDCEILGNLLKVAQA